MARSCNSVPPNGRSPPVTDEYVTGSLSTASVSGVGGDRPEALAVGGVVGRLVPVHRRLAAVDGEQLVRESVGEVVQVGEVDAGERAGERHRIAPGRVLGGVRVAAHQLVDHGGHLVDLVAGRAGERLLVGQRGIQRRAVQRQPLVGGQPVQQVRFGAAFPHRQRRRHRVLPDHVVGGLAAHAGAHRRHQHLGGGQERQVAVQLALDHRRVGAELVEHRQERLDLPVDGKEASGNATRRTTEQNTSPSFHCAPASSAAIEA